MSSERSFATRPRRVVSLARYGGIAVVVLSLIGGAVGLTLVQSLSDDARATVSVSRSAVAALNDTIEAVDDVAANTAASLGSAADSVDAASATVETALDTIDGVAVFLEEDLPTALESIRMSMPAAIQTANAVDGTLRALSLFGVDYDPEEPFGDSLSRVSNALATLPGELRAQSEALRLLVPSANDLAEDTDALARSMDALEESLAGFTSLTETYQQTIAEAEATIEETDSSLAASLWMVRALVIGAAVIGVVIGLVLVSLGRELETLHDRVSLVEPDVELPATTS